MEILKLTKLEQDILNHRLEAPDTMYEALEEYHEDDIYDICQVLLKGDYDKAKQISESLMKAILVECVAGSTYYACGIGEPWETEQHLGMIAKAGQSLAEKIAVYVGYDKELEFPLY